LRNEFDVNEGLKSRGNMQRYECLKAIAPLLKDDLVVANLANTSTEWRSLRPHEGNLYFVGMGMVAPYAIGLSLALPNRRVVALDGDGGILFDLSALGTLAQTNPANLMLIVFDNEGYASTGKHKSTNSLSAGTVDIAGVAKASGVKNSLTVTTVDDFVSAVKAALKDTSSPHVIVAKIDRSQAFVGTVVMDSKENKYRFARHIEQLEGKTILKPSAREHGKPPAPDPVFKPVAEDDAFAQVLYDGLKENEVDFVIGLPCSGMATAQQKCIDDKDLQYIGVANEGTGFGLCAGAWLGGKRPAALVENLGVMCSLYQILRGHYSYGIPTLIVTEFRGDAGETEFFGECGDMTEPLLEASRINYRVVRELRDLKPAMRDALRWMNFGLRPYAVVPGFDLTRHKPGREK
jgi:sulfopyruvate decarboxylase TPP-binding subunit